MKEWTPSVTDIPQHLTAAKRVNLVQSQEIGNWWWGHGKDESCQIEGTANHWYWLAYTLIGLAKEADCPYSEDKPLPVSKDRVVACLNALTGIPDPAAFVEAARMVDAANARRAAAQVQDYCERIDYEQSMGAALDKLRVELTRKPTGNTGKAVG